MHGGTTGFGTTDIYQGGDKKLAEEEGQVSRGVEGDANVLPGAVADRFVETLHIHLVSDYGRFGRPIL